jgi:hypothetical protein
MSLEINWKKSLYISHMQTNHIQILVITSSYIYLNECVNINKIVLILTLSNNYKFL